MENISVALFFNSTDTSSTIGLSSKSFSFKKPFTIFRENKCLYLIEPIKSDDDNNNNNKSNLSKIWDYVIKRNKDFNYINIKKYMITPYESDEDHKVFTIFELITDDDKNTNPIGFEDKIANLLKLSYEAIDEEQVVNIHIHNKPKLPITSLFSLILNDNETFDTWTLKSVIHQLKVELPQYKLSKKDINIATNIANKMRILKSQSSTLQYSSSKFLFGKRRSPRKYVLNVLKKLLHFMQSNFSRVGAPFLCGLSIQMDVINRNGDLEPFFSFSDCPIDFVSPSTFNPNGSGNVVTDNEINDYADILQKNKKKWSN